MTYYEAETLVAALSAAFPWPRPPESTLALYKNELRGLVDVEAASEAVRAVVRSSPKWPPWAAVLEAYQVVVRRKQAEAARERGLPEDEVEPGRDHALAVLARLDAMSEIGPFTTQMRAYFGGIAGIEANGEPEDGH
jgi:hypothetical protein